MRDGLDGHDDSIRPHPSSQAPPRPQASSSSARNRSRRRNAPDRAQRGVPSAPPSRHRGRARASRGRDFGVQRPPVVRNNSHEPLSQQEIARLREVIDWFSGLPDRINSISYNLDSVWSRIGMIEENVRGLSETARPIHHSFHRDGFHSSRGIHRHQPYPGWGHTLIRDVGPARHINTSQSAPLQAPTQETSRAAPTAPVPVATESVGTRSRRHNTQNAPQPPPVMPIASGTALPSNMAAGSPPARSTRSSRRAPVPITEYRWVDQGTGLRYTLNVSPAGLPLFPGSVASAFQALQGPTPSPTELTRRIWLLYRGRKVGDIWGNAVAAAREIRHKVVLPQPLLLLLELDDLPRNEWEKITYLWSTSATPMSSISPGIRLNPQGFAGLDNHDIDTADLIRMWTSGNLKKISTACGQQKDRPDVKGAFHIAITSPNFWASGVAVTQPWRPSTSLKRLRYIGKLEPAIIATWLREEVGLNAYEVASRFQPFSLRAFNTDAATNARKQYTEMVLPEIYPGLSDDSLPDFGADLEWTPAHGPCGPPLKSRDSTSLEQPSTSQGAADAIDTPMEM